MNERAWKQITSAAKVAALTMERWSASSYATPAQIDRAANSLREAIKTWGYEAPADARPKRAPRGTTTAKRSSAKQSKASV